jgi:hypothetical protein
MPDDTTHASLALSSSAELQSSAMISVAAFLVLCLIYHLLAPIYNTPKQLAWILTAVSSAVMTISSMPFVWDYVAGGGSVKNVRTFSPLALAANRFFQGYLIADLAMAAMYYADQVNFLTGWVHHVVYVLIVEMALRRSWAHIFCLCASMELPTFILAFTILHPRFRSNVLFAVSFFATRIMFHIILCISYLLPHNRAHATGGSYLPSTILSFVFPLHAAWFHGCIKGFSRRRNQAKSPPSSPVIPPDIYAEMPPPVASAETSPSPPPATIQQQPTADEYSMMVPGSFSLPPLRLQLSAEKSFKHGQRNRRNSVTSSVTSPCRTLLERS